MEETTEFTELPQDEPIAVQVKEKKFGLQHILLAICLLLVAGLVILSVMFFNFKKQQGSSAKAIMAATYHREGGLRVAFVNSDTIRSQYQLVKDLQKALQEKYAKLDHDISSKQKDLETRANELQKKFESKQISLEEAQKADGQLKEENKRIYDLNQEYSSKMAQEESKTNEIFINNIDEYLKRYNKKFRFDYILGYSKGAGILYANDTLDITKDVLDGLNREYAEKKPLK